jgi:hypothetical protein
MQGYERHVCNCQQLLYDSDEWGFHSAQFKMHKNSFKNYINTIKKIIKNIPYIIRIKPTLSFENFITDLTNKKLYIQIFQCKKCKYSLICPGIDRPYPKIYGIKEVIPALGQKIKDPMFYRSTYLDEYEKKHSH